MANRMPGAASMLAAAVVAGAAVAVLVGHVAQPLVLEQVYSCASLLCPFFTRRARLCG